ncbi:uncharacterized protein cd44a [Ictalurus furcatus]|uniref:uncharacterized protein cd44a n=1 Tax=Ictalurus furcatus TaxID=66913 RepID=UPI00234FB686|nr:uncharacterized protein cd44a [Ictalurus furcatus]
MHTLLLVMVTSGLVLLQTSQGLTENLEQDDFLEEAMAEGFIVGTKGPTKTEKPQDNYNVIITHDSLNPEANLSLFQKDSLPTVTIAKPPKGFTNENAKERPKNESAAVLNTVGSSQTTTLSPEENAEGSGMFPERVIEMHTAIETVAEVDISSDGSGMFSETLNEKQEEDLQFTTTVRTSGELDNSTLVFDSAEKNGESRMGPEVPTSDWLTTTSTIIVEAEIIAHKNNEVAVEKPLDESTQDLTVFSVLDPEPTISARVKEGTPGWLLILALCLTLGAVICVFAGIATKDMWYEPSRKCLNINSTESKKHEEYDKAATLPMSEKEIVALMSSQNEERKNHTIISLDEVPEKEYLM